MTTAHSRRAATAVTGLSSSLARILVSMARGGVLATERTFPFPFYATLTLPAKPPSSVSMSAIDELLRLKMIAARPVGRDLVRYGLTTEARRALRSGSLPRESADQLEAFRPPV